MKKQKVLIIEGDKASRAACQELLATNANVEFSVLAADDHKMGALLCKKEMPDCVLYGAHSAESFQKIRKVKKQLNGQAAPFILLIDNKQEDKAISALKRGLASDYLVRSSINQYGLEKSIFCAVEKSSLEKALGLQRESLMQIAMQDSLTGLLNRRGLDQVIEQVYAEAERHDRMFAILMIDIDHFKLVNDQYGHMVGDQLLKEIADRLNSHLRGDDIICRYGGDEFVVVLRGIRDFYDVDIAAEKLINVLSETYQVDGDPVAGSASIGIAIFPYASSIPREIIRCADQALYRAKTNGRGIYEYFLAEMNEKHKWFVKMCADAKNLVEKDQLFLTYQPKMFLADEKITGVEAFLRWRHPEQGVIAARDFISVLERSGMMPTVGKWILEKACQQIASLNKSHPGTKITVAVNLSPRQLLEEGLVEHVKAMLKKYNVQGNQLEIEISDNFIIEAGKAVVSQLEALHEFSIQIAIDNFGAHSFSLQQLCLYPIDSLKIAQSITCLMADDEDYQTLVKSIISLGKTLEIPVIAAGVETAGQLEFLKKHGCELAQGFYFGELLSADEVLSSLSQP